MNQPVAFTMKAALLLLLTTFASPVWGVDCSTSDITLLSTQQQVDNFQTTYGGGGVCDRVSGQLQVSGGDITNLDGLANLTSVGWTLYIFDNTALTNLDGLANLTSVGRELYIFGSTALTNLDGLAKLTSVGWNLNISRNAALTNLDGLANLTSVGGAFWIQYNAALTNIDGLVNLTSVEELYITNNAALTNLDGLANLTSHKGHLYIGTNAALTNLDGLVNLTSVAGRLGIEYNAALTNLNGLAKLTSVGSDLVINNNAALTNLDGLVNLTSVAGVLYIHDNATLSLCYGLTTLLNAVDDAEPGPGTPPIPDVGYGVTFANNLPGCNSVEEALLPPPTYSIGGSVSGLESSGLVLQNNAGDDLTINANGSFTFPTALNDGSSYHVTIRTQPFNPGQTCSVSNGSGNLLHANITNVQVSCATFEMNVGLNDAWYYPVTNGQGFFITVFPDIGYVSVSWFTYDTERPDVGVTANLGEPGHRWLMALGKYSGNQAVMDISITSGGIFDIPSETTEVKDGTMRLTFTDCENGTIEYDIPSINQKGFVPIQRIANDNIAVCEALVEHATTQQHKDETSYILSLGDSATPTEAQPLVNMNVGLNDAWYYPVTNGQGFFINVFPLLGYVSLSWFTYDTVRPPKNVTANLGDPGHRWLNALGQISGNKSVMDISIASGGLFDTATEIAEVKDGTITLTFSDCNSGTVEYDIPSINRQGTVPIQRVANDNIALCEALNAD